IMTIVSALKARRNAGSGVLLSALNTTTVLALTRFHTSSIGNCLPSGVMTRLAVASIWTAMITGTCTITVTSSTISWPSLTTLRFSNLASDLYMRSWKTMWPLPGSVLATILKIGDAPLGAAGWDQAALVIRTKTLETANATLIGVLL